MVSDEERVALGRSHQSASRDADDAFLYGRIDVIDAKHFVHSTSLNGFRGHAENHAGGFILGQNQASGSLDRQATSGTVVAHAGQDRGDTQRAGKFGGALQSHVNIWQITVDAARSAVQLQTAGGGDAEMLPAGTNVHRSRAQRFVDFGFFHANAGELGELRTPR